MDPDKTNQPAVTPETPKVETPAPVGDTPSFMNGIVDPSEDQVKAREVLSGDPENPNPETPATPETPKEGDEPASGETPETPATPENPNPETPKEGDEPKPGETPKEGDQPPAQTPVQQEEQQRQSTEKVIDGAIKTRELDPHLKNLISKPLIKIDVPETDSYKDKDGNFDLQNYMQDALSRIVVELQKSIAGGSLGAIQFGILKRGIQEESQEKINAIKTDEQAKQTWDKLAKKFPILNSDENVANRFVRAIRGEKVLRAEKAKAEGKQYVDLAYEDYEKLAAELIGGQPAAPAAPKAPTESMTGSPQMGGGSTRGKDPTGDAIDDMVALKNKKGFIF